MPLVACEDFTGGYWSHVDQTGDFGVLRGNFGVLRVYQDVLNHPASLA